VPRQQQLQHLLSNQTKRLLLSLPQLQLSNFELDDKELELDPEVDLYHNYNRLRIVTVDLDEEDDQVSDYVATRLAQAREKAMQAYYSKYGKTA
jgi:hypothetical protein